MPQARFAALCARVREAILARVGLAVDAVEVLAPGTLPRTSSGKIRRLEAMKRYLTGTLGPPAPVGPLRLAGALVRSRIGLWKAGRDRNSERTGR